ncbi:hypothetical protein FRC07_004163 [Ceratobasidium sp. 392]|nr:hypothetical protein FRC07_004163 [Ceratobasidium sp. 392]
MEFPGQYVSNGATMTYQQPPESLGPITSVPYTAVVPKSSNCVQYQSNDLYAAATTSAAASTSAASSGSSAVATGSASHSGSSSASRSTASATGSANASMRNVQQGPAFPAMIVAGVVGFGGLLGVIAAL